MHFQTYFKDIAKDAKTVNLYEVYSLIIKLILESLAPLYTESRTTILHSRVMDKGTLGGSVSVKLQ